MHGWCATLATTTGTGSWRWRPLTGTPPPSWRPPPGARSSWSTWMSTARRAGATLTRVSFPNFFPTQALGRWGTSWMPIPETFSCVDTKRLCWSWRQYWPRKFLSDCKCHFEIIQRQSTNQHFAICPLFIDCLLLYPTAEYWILHNFSTSFELGVKQT